VSRVLINSLKPVQCRWWWWWWCVFVSGWELPRTTSPARLHRISSRERKHQEIVSLVYSRCCYGAFSL